MTVAIVCIVHNKGKLLRSMHRFNDVKDLRIFWQNVAKSGVSFHTIKCKTPSPSPNSFQGTWCPYCAKERNFIKNYGLDTYNCMICGVSDSEYFVRKYNGRN